MFRFVFWQGLLSMHQSAFLRSLASYRGNEVVLISWESDCRINNGWYKPDFGNTSIKIKPSLQEQKGLLFADPAHSIHIFSGTRGHPFVWKVLLIGLTQGDICIGIQSEAYDPQGIKGILRCLRGIYDAKYLKKYVKFILGIGKIGVNWYERCGYSSEIIYPFAYFVEKSLASETTLQESLSEKSYNLIFVGSDLHRKGLRILLYALKELVFLDWNLNIVGDKDDRTPYQELCKKYGLENRIKFHGTLPNCDVLKVMMSADLLVLPSLWDGWGAVVNEALMCGVPVVCSDRCGAADLLDHGERGEVFSSGSASALCSILERRIKKGKRDKKTTRIIQEWSDCITGKSAAVYFMDVINASIDGREKPKPPWLG